EKGEMRRVAYLLLAHSPPVGDSPFRLPLSRNPLHGCSDVARGSMPQKRDQENRFLLLEASSPRAGSALTRRSRLNADDDFFLRADVAGLVDQLNCNGGVTE